MIYMIYVYNLSYCNEAKGLCGDPPEIKDAQCKARRLGSYRRTGTTGSALVPASGIASALSEKQKERQ